MTDYSSMTREELLEIGMTRGFPDLLDQWKFVPTRMCGHEPVLTILDEFPRFCGFHAAKYLAKRNAQQARMSKLHKAYRGKKKSW